MSYAKTVVAGVLAMAFIAGITMALAAFTGFVVIWAVEFVGLVELNPSFWQYVVMGLLTYWFGGFSIEASYSD